MKKFGGAKTSAFGRLPTDVNRNPNHSVASAAGAALWKGAAGRLTTPPNTTRLLVQQTGSTSQINSPMPLT